MNQTEQLPSAGNSNACITTRPPIGAECDMNYSSTSDWLSPDRPLPTFVQPCGVWRERTRKKRRRRRRWWWGGWMEEGCSNCTNCELQVDSRKASEWEKMMTEKKHLLHLHGFYSSAEPSNKFPIRPCFQAQTFSSYNFIFRWPFWLLSLNRE